MKNLFFLVGLFLLPAIAIGQNPKNTRLGIIEIEYMFKSLGHSHDHKYLNGPMVLKYTIDTKGESFHDIVETCHPEYGSRIRKFGKNYATYVDEDQRVTFRRKGDLVLVKMKILRRK